MIVAYAEEHGTSEAKRTFYVRFPVLNESTIRSFCKAAKRGKAKRTCPLKLSEKMDERVQLKLKHLRKKGVAIGSTVAIAVARGVIMANCPSILKENGGSLDLGKGWAQSLFRRMGLTKRHATTGRLSLPAKYVKEMSFRFTQGIAASKKQHNVDAKLILNWDQTSLKYVPSGSWTMAEKGSSRVEVAGLSDKKCITGLLTVNADGDMLPLQLIYTGKTNRCHPTQPLPTSFDVTHNPTHWSTETTMLSYIDNVLEPYIKKTRGDLQKPEMPCILIYDAFRGHQQAAIVARLNKLNVIHHQVPPLMTDLLQPLDLSVNKPVKDFIRNKFTEWYSQRVMEVSNEELSELLKLADLRNLHAKWLYDMYNHFKEPKQQVIIRNGFAKAGILEALSQDLAEQSVFRLHGCSKTTNHEAHSKPSVSAV